MSYILANWIVNLLHLILVFLTLNFPTLFDAYVVKNKGESSYLYLLCKDNMIVFDNNMNCVLFLSKQNQESKALLDHVRKYYHFDESKMKYKIEDLDEVDKSIYLALQRQNWSLITCM